MKSSKNSLLFVKAVILLLCTERVFAGVCLIVFSLFLKRVILAPSIDLTKKFFPPDVGLRFVRAPEPIAAPPGDDVTFECSLNVPAEQVRWRHNGRYLDQSATSSRSLQNSNHLNVQVKDTRQTGDYQVSFEIEDRWLFC